MNPTRTQLPARPRPRAATRGLAAATVVLILALFSGRAEAKAERVTYHPFDRVWPTAIRFLRVDRGFTILEKDAEAGYVLFAVKEENKEFRGALELVRIKDDSGRPALRLLLRIEDRPTYVEIAVLDKLERKLRDEYGEPPPYVPKPAKPAPSGDPDKDK